MKTPPLMPSDKQQTLLFDDRSLLEAALGKNAWRGVAPKTDCDCISHPDTTDDEDLHPHQVATPAAQAD